MTLPPLPDRSTLHVELVYEPPDANEAGSRFFLRYAGSAPSPANCVSIAGDIGTAWASNMNSLVPANWSLNKVIVSDITTRMGNFGEDDTLHTGTRSGTEIPQQVATNVEFKLQQKYRGGKPRIYLPPGVNSDVVNDVHWTDDFIAAVNSGVAGFFTDVQAISVGSVGALTHTMVSFYHLFDNKISSSGRAYAAPRYRDPNALTIDVNGYTCKQLLSSQRRRRTSTTP